MSDVLQGFFLFIALAVVGFALARSRAIPASADQVLARVCFFAATPALMFVTIYHADLSRVFSGTAVVSLLVPLVVIGAALVGGLWLNRRRGRETSLAQVVIPALSCGYVNAGNLGIPIGVLLLGTAESMVPVILMQLLFLAPITFAILDWAEAGPQAASTNHAAQAVGRMLLIPVKNPLVLAVILGVVLNMGGWQLPALLYRPIESMAGAAVPLMLMALGISFNGAKLPGREGIPVKLISIVSTKLLLSPLLGLLFGLAFGLRGDALLAVLVTTTLPTAQNVFTYALRYNKSVPLMRDMVMITTIGCMPVLLLIVSLFR